MAFRIDRKLEEKIIELRREKIMTGKDIAAELTSQGYKVSKSVVYKYLKMNQEIPAEKISPIKKIKKINELISVRLFWFCNDLSVLSKRLAMEIVEQKPEKIIVPTRLQAIIKKEKMDKVVNILEAANLSVNLEYVNA